MLKLSGGKLEKAVRVNPFNRPKLGTIIYIEVDGEQVAGLVPPKGKYTYLTLNGTEYYVTAVLEDGEGYETEEVAVKPKKVKAE